MKIPLIDNLSFGGKRKPLFIRRSQRWYWTEEWQRGEREAEKEIAEGKTHHFESGRAAADWLLGKD